MSDPFDRLPAPIPGLEGPFRFKSGQVAYWDPREGRYYDRSTDLYLSDDEATAMVMGTDPFDLLYQMQALGLPLPAERAS